MPQHIGKDSIARPALLARLVRVAPRSVVLLSAPAGFGKTRVLAQWAKRARRAGATVAWVDLKASDRNVERLFRAIADALRLAGAGHTAPMSLRARRAPAKSDAEVQCDRLMAAIGTRPRKVLLCLDDFHAAESEEVDAFLQRAFERMPRNLMLALASRRPTDLAVSKLLLDRRLERIGEDDLAFSSEETKEYFGKTLTPAELRSAQALTGGWPAALRMVELCREAWRTSKSELMELPMFLELLTEYVFVEALAGIDEESTELLVGTSIVESMESTLAESIAGGAAPRRLDALASSSGLLRPAHAGSSAWRVWPAIRLALLKRLERRGTEHVGALHARAAAWYEKHDRLRDAVRHYVAAGKPDVAAAAVERAGPVAVVMREGDDATAAILRPIPAEHIEGSPRLALCRLYLDYKQGFVTETGHRYEEISRRTAGFTVDREGGDNERLAMEAAFVDLVMQVYQHSCVSRSFLKSIEQRLALASQNLSLAMTVQLVLGLLFRLRGDLEPAGNAFAETEKLNARIASPWMVVWLHHHFGALAVARGQLHDARHRLQTGLKMWRNNFRHDLSYRALTYILLAEIDYEFDALSEAQAKIDEALHSAEHVEGWAELYTSVYETAAMLALHRDGIDAAEMLLGRAENIPKIRALLKNFLPAMRMRIAALGGNALRAREIATKQRLARLWNSNSSRDDLGWREWDLIGTTLCRLATQEGDEAGAIGILDRMYSVVRLAGRLRAQVLVHILRADIARRRGETRSAIQYLLRALEIGCTQGYQRVFLDEGVAVRELLPLLEQAPAEELPAHIASFAARIGRALDHSRRAPDDGLLSAREREVMRELGLGHSNKLIARKLTLSEPTVKFHVQNIFRKLDVRRRASAVAEAHRRGLLT